MTDSGDPTDLYDVPEDQRLEVDEAPIEAEDLDSLDVYRDELRGEVVDLTGGLEAAGGFAAYESSRSPCSGGAKPGTKAFARYFADRFPAVTKMGLYSCRNVAGSSEPSQHSEGRGIDIHLPTSSGKARTDLGDPIVDLIRSEGRALGVQLLIWNRKKWGARYQSGKDYGGRSPHYDHIHVSLTRDAAAKLTYATLERLLGKGDPVEVAKLDGATHTVDATSLNVRAEPTTSGAKVGSLANRSQVIVKAGAPQQADGFEWVQIEASGNMSGWVATKFLDAIPGAASPAVDTTPADTTVAPGLAATHRVNTERDGLNLRAAPSTDGELITELPKGSDVATTGATAQADGLDWAEVQASVGGNIVKGWVAAKYLAAK
ncbi:MAG TPA: SH3 domain-containing protein [Acidimicrobiia bacterium]|jgi:uncharacterized protein YraI|nr:SH3 domain-containing protein [Acidimicrobiia bacterium]